jgi:carbon monoxide dehydrogenase subunit G
VKIGGTWPVPFAQERAYLMLQDPAVLCRCMPGCESLQLIGEQEYAMRMKMVLASISGAFDGKVRITETEPPTRFRLTVEGSGRIGFMKGSGLLTLSPAAGGSSVQYDGDVQVGGTIASVGQRMIETTAKMLIKRFFDKLGKEAAVLESAAD